MELTVEDQNDDVLTVKLSDSNEAVANALRRAMITRVDTLAVKHVDIVNNESGMFDEMLAHRIGQIPFTIPEKFGDEDKVHIALKREGPVDVLASDIKTDNDEAQPVNSNAIIVSLKENQEVDLEGEAVLGKGVEHAKHQGGTVGYEKDGDDYVFRVESTSGYSNEELVNTAIAALKQELEEFEEAVEDL